MSGETTSTDQIKEWRSIVTLVVFVFTNIIVLFPFHIPVYIPRRLSDAFLDTLSSLRIISPRQSHHSQHDAEDTEEVSRFVRLRFPMNFVTAPLIADLFLLAILAIGRKEVHDGTVGADHISPLDIMIFFITLAYIAISIDASGLIRYMAFKVLQWGGEVGHRLFFYLYAFFFSLGSFIGNDPIILSGTAFLAYMTRVSSNIVHPRAWIHTQFAVANIASAILVSSNPTNLVLAGAFQIKFIHYTANMVVPAVITAVVLFPFLLYFIFADESLIPLNIKMHELPEEVKSKQPVNPNIPHARGNAEDQEDNPENEEQGKLLSLEEIMNPFLDKGGAAFGAVVMAATLITVLALNAASTHNGEYPIFWVTLPAAFIMFCWDVVFGWFNRHQTREIARNGRQEAELARAERTIKEQDEKREASQWQSGTDDEGLSVPSPTESMAEHDKQTASTLDESTRSTRVSSNNWDPSQVTVGGEAKEHGRERDLERRISREVDALRQSQDQPTTLVSLVMDVYSWLQTTFPTVTAVLAHLPFALVPFAFTMFVLVQALVTKGWVQVFAHGWDHWAEKTGTVGSIGGMGFLSVILCNFAGTNIGTTILLSRVIQAWQKIHDVNGTAISDRTFWATVYSMALGVNYGAFSMAFSGSLAGLLWRDILARKHIRVRRLEFARVNLPIIAISMIVGCIVLVAEVYIMRDDTPYHLT